MKARTMHGTTAKSLQNDPKYLLVDQWTAKHGCPGRSKSHEADERLSHKEGEALIEKWAQESNVDHSSSLSASLCRMNQHLLFISDHATVQNLHADQGFKDANTESKDLM